MTLATPFGAAILIAATAVGVAWAGRTAIEARAGLVRSRSALSSADAHAREIVALRALGPAEASARRATAELPARVTAVLSSCGLPSTALKNFASDPSRPASTPDRPERASVVLEQITLPQTGRFMASWREAEPGWVIVGIEMTPAGMNPAGGDVPLRVLLNLQAHGPAAANETSR